MDHDILTIEEVAAYLRVSDRTVYDWAQKGEVPGGKLGTSWRFKRTEIEKWVDERLGGRRETLTTPPVELGDLLAPERVIMFGRTNKTDALNALIHCLSSTPEVRDPAEFRAEIFRRERLMSTGIGLGVAVPHVRLASVSDVVVAVGRSDEGIADYESLDGKPVQLVVMVGAASDQHAHYLRTLATVSARVKDEGLRAKLFAAPDPETICTLLSHGAP